MAVEHDFKPDEAPKPRQGFDFGGGGYIQIDKSALERIKEYQQYFFKPEGFKGFDKGVNMFIQEYPPDDPPAPPRIVFQHGDVEKSITLTEADLRPQNAFKLNQKIGAMIKSAYNTKTKGVKNGKAKASS